jgi:phage FluMu gp28-like protein
MSKFFLPYQARWITDPSRKQFMVKSRQIGISLATAYDLVRKTVTASGNVRFEDERTRDGHAGRFWAACAVVEAAATCVNPNHIYAQLI